MPSLYDRLYEQSLSSSGNLSSLEARIEELNQEINVSRSKIRSLYEHARKNADKVGNYFTALFTKNSDKTRALIASYPISSVAGWQTPQWQSWDPQSAREEPYLRVGELVEKRAGGSFSIPAYISFLGQSKTIIIRSNKTAVEQGLALAQSLLIRTALMLPHKARYTLLDPAGNGIAFPMRRYLPLVRENTGDVRRDLDQVVVDIQRIIETYLDASIKSFELVPQEIRINERFQFVFAADFPNQYDRRAIEALQSIGNTGPAAGTYLFIHHNSNYELPRDMSWNDFKNAHYITNGASFRVRTQRCSS